MSHQLNLSRRLFAVILAAIAALVVSIAPLGNAQSAQASTGTVVCIWINGHKYCFTVPYAIDPIYLHCPGCPQLAFNHGDIVAAVLRPFVSEANWWMLAHHPVFQVYFYGQHLGIDPNERDEYRDSPYFDRTAEFCARYDEVSFDPDYASEPMSTFAPMVRRVLHKEWTPPT